MTDILEYKCPACGAPIKYDGVKEKMVCEFCDTVSSLEDLRKYDADLNKESANREFDRDEDKMQEELSGNFTGMNCSSCGAEIVGDQNTVANECPYCGNTNIIKKQVSGIYKPDFIIPFKIKKEAAVAALKNHYKGKRLLPDAFTKDNRVEKIQGVYVPFWLVDGKTRVDAHYEASKVVSTWSDKNYDYTKTNYYTLTRCGDYYFEKVPVDASSKMADDLMEAIEPFDNKELQDFATAYLAGYLTDKYDVENTECQKRANERIQKTAEYGLKNSISEYSVECIKKCDIRLEEGKISYALFPVWLLTTRYQGDAYTFAMNGQTGKFIGNLPVDKGKLHKYMAAAFFGGFAVSFVAIKYLMLAILSI